MDSNELDRARQENGAAYLKAIDDLGLRPDALVWAFDQHENRADNRRPVDSITLGDVEFRRAWVYRVHWPAGHKTEGLGRTWKKLETSVDRLAA